MKLKILAGAAALVAVALTLAIGAMATASADTPQNCIPTSPDDPTCLWQLKLTKVEVAVEYEYPYCEIKLIVEHNFDDRPDGVQPEKWSSLSPQRESPQVFYMPVGEVPPMWYTSYNSKIANALYVGENPYYIHSGAPKMAKLRVPEGRYDHTSSGVVQRKAEGAERWQNITLGSLHARAVVSYDWQSEFASEFARERRVGNKFVHYKNKLPVTFISNAIPLSHTFAGLTEEIFTCFEVAKREHGRVEERSALDTEKAGLRQSLKLLEAELTRAREHELDATNVLKEVIAISARVEEARRAIQRLRVEGIAERRKLIERYYAEESQRYSVFVKSLEASASALAASDKAIAAHKAELEASRARLDALVAAAQEAEAELIAEVKRAQDALGED